MAYLHGRNGIFEPVEGVLDVVTALPLQSVVVGAFVGMAFILKAGRRRGFIFITLNVNVLLIAAHAVCP